MKTTTNTSLIAIVDNEIHGSSPLEYLKSLGKGVVSNKLKAMVASALYVGPEKTKKKLESVLKALSAFDIKSERQAMNYVLAGKVIIKSEATEEQVMKIGLSRIMTFAGRLLDEENVGDSKQVEATIKEYEVKKAEKQAKAAEEAKTAKAEAKQAALNAEELLNEEFDEEEGLTATRVWAHLTVWADAEGFANELEQVLGTNAVTGLNKFKAMIKHTAKEMNEAIKKEAEAKVTGKKAAKKTA